MIVKFTIPGAAKAKQRPRVNTKTGRIYTPQATHKYEKAVKEAYSDNYFFDGEYISIKILFKFKIPKSYTKKQYSEALAGVIRPSRADIDNYIKSVLDGLNKVAYSDDRYIYKIDAEKIFADKDETIVEIKNWKIFQIWLTLVRNRSNI